MEQKVIQYKEKTLNYICIGRGKQVVFLHGIPTYSGLWDEVLPYIYNDYSVYAFDLLGFGSSQRAESSELTVERQAELLVGVFSKLGINDAVVAGHDIGGAIALHMALKNPELIRALVLVDSACYDSWPIDILKVENRVALLFEHLPEDILYNTFLNYIREGFYYKDRAEKAAAKYWNYIKGQTKGFLNAISSFDSRYTEMISGRLHEIAVPTLILWGKYDKFINLEYGYRLGRDIKGAEVHVIENGGHFLPEDNPTEAGNGILEFLRKLK